MSDLTLGVAYQIKRLCKEGEQATASKQYKVALMFYRQAWALLPEPQQQQPAALYILTALAEAHFLMKDYATALSCFEQANQLPNAFGNPYIHLRYGQCLFEMRKYQQAAEQLALAYTGDSGKVFSGEDERYLAFLRAVIALP